MCVVDQDRSRLHKYSRQSYGALPFADALLLSYISIEDDYRWYVHDVFGYDDCGSHENFEKLFFGPTRGIEGEPRRVDERATDISMSNVLVKRMTILTSFQEASYGTQSREGSLGPSTADRRSTILTLAISW